MTVGSVHFLLCGVYIPPGSSVDIYKYHTLKVEELHSKLDNINLLLIGDYNLPKTTWHNKTSEEDSLNINCVHQDSQILDCALICVNSFSYLDLNQHFGIHPDKGYSLDLCFSSSQLNICQDDNFGEDLLSPDVNHKTGYFLLNLNRPKIVEPKLSVKNYYKANFQEICIDLNNVNWDSLLNNDDIEIDTNIFYAKIHEIIDKKVPESNTNNQSPISKGRPENRPDFRRVA